ncbi:hypothetical protein AB0B25_11835 [Nocardia sp. NPDC049190]|uniref:hypothetical protein n=1 Tax=Nocardia sp. NPDC049190 TaxID=3155650 RepID=UPI0033E1F01D
MTSLRVRLHPVPRLLAGFLMYPWPETVGIWERLRELLADSSDELTVQTGVLSGPEGAPMLLVSPCWSGDPAVGEQHIDDVRELGNPVVSQVAAMTHGEMLRLWDAHVVTENHYALGTRSVAEFTPGVIAALVHAGAHRTAPHRCRLC